MSNALERFNSLLPKSPRLIGTISASYGNGEYLVDLISGGSVSIRSVLTTYSNGDRVFVRNGVIEGKAPNLTTSVLDI